MYSRRPPVNILTRDPAARAFGGVSPLGLAATVVGAVTSAFLAMLLFHAFGYAIPTGPDAVLLHHRVRRRGLARGQRAGRGHASEVPLSERR